MFPKFNNKYTSLQTQENSCREYAQEHDMNVIYSVAKEIYVLDRGDLIFNGTPNQVKKSVLVNDRYIGIKK